MTITLYELQPSPHARKVRLLAAELGIPLEKVPLDPRIGETRSAEYLAKNPNGRIPTLKRMASSYGIARHPEISRRQAAGT
jgi:glutathione S-transferase